MEPSAVFGFAAVAVALVVVPGPDWAYVLAAGARDHVVLPAVAGIVAGYAVITAIVVAGVGPLIAAAPGALIALTVGGASYLIHLGVRTVRGTARVSAAEGPGTSSWGYVSRGAGVSAMNPKGLLIFLSILPQFTHPGGWPLVAQLATLGGVFMLICTLFYLPLGHAASRVLGARPGVARITAKIAGGTMVLVGVLLLAERLTAS